MSLHRWSLVNDRGLVVHCSGSPTTTTLEVIEGWHRENGWRCSTSGVSCGYHYVIQKGGVVRKGRPDHAIGAHVAGFNTGRLGICVTGSPAKGKPWDPEEERALVLLLTDLCRAYRLDSSAVVGHCDLDPEAKPDCPGVDMGAIRERVRVRLEATT